MPPRELFSLPQVYWHILAHELGNHVSPINCIVHTCQEGTRSQLQNQDICLCSSRRYERLSLRRLSRLPPISAWQVDALMRGKGNMKWFGRIAV